MAYSQNGWPAFTDYGDAGLVGNPLVPGTNVRVLGGLRAGPVAAVLLHCAARWHREVEPLVQSEGIWGFEPRNIRGSTQLSNHASGTAVDLNAVLHPMGVSGTVARRSALRSILEECGGLVRWGGDYAGRIDEMHLEINGSSEPVTQLAARLGTVVHPAPTPPPSPPRGAVPVFPLPSGYYYGPHSGPTESISGMADEPGTWVAGLVAAQQRLVHYFPGCLARYGCDGKYGEDATGETHDAVVRFQSAHALSADGLIGPRTWGSLWK